MKFKVSQSINGAPYRLDIPAGDRTRLERVYLESVGDGVTAQELRSLLVASGEVDAEQVQAFDLTMNVRFFLDERRVDDNFLSRPQQGDRQMRLWLTPAGWEYLRQLQAKVG